MKVLVSASCRVQQTPDGSFWTNNQSLTYDFWSRYLDVFDHVELLLRAEPVSEPKEGWKLVTGPNITGVPLPSPVGVMKSVGSLLNIYRIVKKKVKEGGAFQCRLPCFIGGIVIQALAKGQPYGVEVVGDPYTVLEPEAFRHPLQPIIQKVSTFRMKEHVKHAAVAAYVTEKTLQERYPNPAFSTHFSSIKLNSADIVEKPRSYGDLATFKISTMGTLQGVGKGMDTLLDALALLPKHTHLEILGDGATRPALEEQARQLGVQERVTFHGHIKSKAKLLSLLDATDLFVLASRGEGLPRSVIEAMARALPALGTNVGGIPELVPEPYLFPPNDSQALAQRISRLLDQPKELEAMSSRNLEKSKEYRQDILRHRRQTLYQTLLEKTEKWYQQR